MPAPSDTSLDMPFDMQPTLTGERLLVRPIRETDRGEMFAAASDPQIWALHPSPDRYREPVFRAYFDAAIASRSAFAFVDRHTGEIVGSSRYHGADPERSEIEIGWTFLVRRCWGGDWNLDAKRLMLGHAFRWFDTVVFWVGAGNQRSRRAMEKIGGVLRDGTFRREAGGDHPYVVFEIRKRNWRGGTAPARAAGQAGPT
jgi:RimJ/RimL family protein N-acetyltransferase